MSPDFYFLRYKEIALTKIYIEKANMLIETGSAPHKPKTKGGTEVLVVIQIHRPIHQKHDVFRINKNFPV